MNNFRAGATETSRGLISLQNLFDKNTKYVTNFVSYESSWDITFPNHQHHTYIMIGLIKSHIFQLTTTEFIERDWLEFSSSS